LACARTYIDSPQAIGLSRNIITVLLATFEIIWESIVIQGRIWEVG